MDRAFLLVYTLRKNGKSVQRQLSAAAEGFVHGRNGGGR
jgi:hypothetical protein